MDKRINNGGARKGAGRKSKASEQKLIENLTPMNEKALKSLEQGIDKKEQWAVKLFFEYFYGKPCLLYTSPSPRDSDSSRMPSSA